MRSQPDQLEVHAARCEAAAAVATDPGLRHQFKDLAWQWRELANLLRSLRADSVRRGTPPRD